MKSTNSASLIFLYFAENTTVGQNFCNILVCACISCDLKLFKTWLVPTVAVSIVVVGALLHSVCTLKATQMNVQCCLTWVLTLYEFKLDHNAAEATKNIFYVKGEGVVDDRTVIIWLKKFCLGCKNLDDQIKIMDSEVVL